MERQITGELGRRGCDGESIGYEEESHDEVECEESEVEGEDKEGENLKKDDRSLEDMSEEQPLQHSLKMKEELELLKNQQLKQQKLMDER